MAGFNRLAPLGKAIRDRAIERRREAATELRDMAKAEASVDTGDLRDSIRLIPQGDATDLVEVGAEHGTYVNNGTRKMAANPFWDRAVEQMRAKYPGYFKGLL